MCVDLWLLLSRFLSLAQATWGTKQTLSEHCNPAFPRFLALGNRLTHRAKREREGEQAGGPASALSEIKAGVNTNVKSLHKIQTCGRNLHYCSIDNRQF